MQIACVAVCFDYDLRNKKNEIRSTTMFARMLAIVLLIASLNAPAQAGVIVQISNLYWTEGNTSGILDVFVRAKDGTTVDIDNLGLEFHITTSDATRIFFESTQTFPDLTTNVDYLFSGGGAPSGSSIGPFDTFLGGDFSLVGPITLGDTFRLLTRLQLVAPPSGSLAPVAGDTFLVSLVVGTNSFFDDGNFTNDIPYDALDGQITIQPQLSGVVPEPSSFVICLVLAGCGWFRMRRKKNLLLH